MTPSIDVIIPLYNKGPYVERAIASALAQSLPVQVYVADDGSTDDGFSTAKRLAVGDNRIHLISAASTPRTGSGATRNRAIAAGTGDVLAFLDADDWWDAGHLQRLVGALSTDGTVLAHCGVRLFDTSGNVIEERNLLPLPPPEDQFDAVRLEDYWIGCPSAVATRRATLQACGGFAEHLSLGEDWDMWSQLAEHGRVAQSPGFVNVLSLDTPSRTMSSLDGYILRLVVLDRWHDDQPFFDKAVRQNRVHFLHQQVRALRHPHLLLSELPKRMRSEAGELGRAIVPSYRAYLASVALLPVRAAMRVVDKRRGHRL